MSKLKASPKYEANSDITAVIACLGEDSLKATIRSLLQGTIKPYEILICIPVEFVDRVTDLSHQFDCISIVPSKVKGQVPQRALGFKKSKTKYTLQLDADVLVTSCLLENLQSDIRRHEGVSVGPIIYRKDRNTIYSYLSDDCQVFHSWQRRLLVFILNGFDGYQSGAISKGGIGFGADSTLSSHKVEWMPGCCLLHETKNLILDDFYACAGKAYSEDLFHSYLLREKGVKLRCNTEAVLEAWFPVSDLMTIQAKVKEQLLHIKAQLRFIKLAKKNQSRFLIYKLLSLLFLKFNRVRGL